MKKRLIISELLLVVCASMILFCACQGGTEQTTLNAAETSSEEVSTGKAIELDPSLTVLRTAKGNIILNKKEIDSNSQVAQIEFKDMNTDIRCRVKCIEIKGERYFFSVNPDKNEDYCLIFDTKSKPYFFLQTFQPAFGTIFLVDKRTLKASKLIPDELDGISREESFNTIKEDMMENPDAFEWASSWIKYEFFDEEYERLFYFAPFLKKEYPLWSIDVRTKETKFVTNDLTNYYMPSYMGSYNKYAMDDRENLLVVMDELYKINLNTHKGDTVKILPEASSLLDYSYPYAVFTTTNGSIVKYSLETKKGYEIPVPYKELKIGTAILSKDGKYIACGLIPRDEGILAVDTKTNKKSIFLKGKLLNEYFWTEDGNLIAVIDEDIKGDNDNEYGYQSRQLSYKLLL